MFRLIYLNWCSLKHQLTVRRAVHANQPGTVAKAPSPPADATAQLNSSLGNNCSCGSESTCAC
jgi:hypothetical protein